MMKCVYSSAPWATDEQTDHQPLQTPPHTFHSHLSSATLSSEGSPPLQLPTYATLSSAELKLYDSSADWTLPASDTDLYHHYLQHTGRLLSQYQSDQATFQIGMPTLAMQSKTVFHSLLAVSGACRCLDIIANEWAPDVNTVSQLLATAYRHYSLASGRMRQMMSGPHDALKPEALLASSVLLVPFATASQQVNHWISTNSGPHGGHKFLAITPRDVIVVMRGVRTIIEALVSNRVTSNIDKLQEMDFATDHPSWLQDSSHSPPETVPSRTHVMYPILAATSQGAFSKLQERLAFTSLFKNDADTILTACSAAFDVLNDIRANAFSPPRDAATQPNKLQGAFLPQIAPWLRSYTNETPIPLVTEPLTRYCLAFLVQVPQAYLDLVLPLLDQRLENPIGADAFADLTREEALALDIYAHWSVLMFLVEEESFYFGKLPVVGLTGLFNRYGDDFVSRLWPGAGGGEEKGWPRSMLNIMREIKGC
jgi:hypothetical protein